MHAKKLKKNVTINIIQVMPGLIDKSGLLDIYQTMPISGIEYKKAIM